MGPTYLDPFIHVLPVQLHTCRGVAQQHQARLRGWRAGGWRGRGREVLEGAEDEEVG